MSACRFKVVCAQLRRTSVVISRFISHPSTKIFTSFYWEVARIFASDSGVLPSFRSLGSWFGLVRAGRLGLKCCDSFPSAASFVLCARRRRGPRCSCLSHLLFTRLLWLFFPLPFCWRLPSGLTGAAFTSVWAPPGILICIVPVRSCVCNCVSVFSFLACPPRLLFSCPWVV